MTKISSISEWFLVVLVYVYRFLCVCVTSCMVPYSCARLWAGKVWAARYFHVRDLEYML